MNLNDYQVWTSTTAIYPGADKKNQEELVYLALGLSDEAGEVAGKVKKYLRDGVLDHDLLAKELGDVMWYVMRLASWLDMSGEALLDMNVEKLSKRKERGTIGGNGDTR